MYVPWEWFVKMALPVSTQTLLSQHTDVLVHQALLDKRAILVNHNIHFQTIIENLIN